MSHNSLLLVFQEEDEELSKQMTELKSERDACVKEENKIKSSKIEIDQELDKCEGVIKENKAKISHAKKQVCVCVCLCQHRKYVIM